MHICTDEIRLILPLLGYVTAFVLPWLGWLRSWWHHRRAHAKCKQERALSEMAEIAQKAGTYK